MELRILGPVELLIDGQTVALGRRQQRLILGVLALQANQLVSRERLIDVVWSGSPSPHAPAVLHSRVSEIRSALNNHVDGSHILVNHGSGYLLNIPPGDVDVNRFHALVRAARQAGSDEDARQLLQEAGQLWRGPVLGGWLPSYSHASLCAGLEDARLTASEDLWNVELRLGNHRLVVDQIASLAALNPDRERLVGLAMTALHRCGRTAEALRHFELSRRWLASEYGVDPSAELRELHRSILGTTRSGPATVPRLLPADTADFTGREPEVAQARAVLTTEGSAGRSVVVTGAAGVGKTALMVHVAHEVSAHFADGQLYADLHGHARRSGTHVAGVLASFLRALRASYIPNDLDGRAALYRSLLAGRNVLVVLDNVRDAIQVRPLLPGASSCAVLISSRARLGPAIGAPSVELDALDKQAAVQLLTRLTGQSRICREPGIAADLVHLCGGLPLAIRVIAARLNAKPHWTLGGLRTRLADERRRLDHLAYGGLDVRASILLSYAGLSVDARTLLCRLGRTGVADVDSWSGAALLDTTTGEAEDLLEELHDARLLDATDNGAPRGHHRYRLPALVRLVAAERAVTDLPADGRFRARSRLHRSAPPAP